MIKASTKSADDTREMASQLASVSRPADVILLSGDLGAGKTTFAQGFGRGLGVAGPIVSPTFTLVRTYPGRLTLVHCDAYRLNNLQEVEDLGLPELLESGGVALVEWGEVVAPALPADFLEIDMDFGQTDDDRIYRLRPVGPAWTARWLSVETATSRWSL